MLPNLCITASSISLSMVTLRLRLSFAFHLISASCCAAENLVPFLRIIGTPHTFKTLITLICTSRFGSVYTHSVFGLL
jgi:hypothetical protein